MDNYLIHYGVPRRSGRYPYGSGKNPYQGLTKEQRSDPHYKYQVERELALTKNRYNLKNELYRYSNYKDSDPELIDLMKMELSDIEDELNSLGNATLFVSGSSKTLDSNSEYYRPELSDRIKNELDSAMNAGKKIVVGDAPGVDSQVQDYLNRKKYERVEIYTPEGKPRYYANSDWAYESRSGLGAPYSKEWLAAKDIAMTREATEGLAIILDDGANATRRNIERLIQQNKFVKVYQINKDGSETEINDPSRIKSK